MRPTIEEHLLGVGRLLDELAADPEMSDDSASLVLAARKQLQRLAASVRARPAFLRWDNAEMSALLGDLAPMLPDELQRLVADSCGSADSADDDAQNDQLRRLITVVMDALPDNESGDRSRLSIVDHLRARTAANPALHKHPQFPWAVASDERATNEVIA